MQQDPKDILLKVLTIICYTEDKNTFIDEFIGLCQQQAFINLIKPLPSEKLASFQEETQAEKVEVLLNQYFTTEERNKALTRATQSLFQSYLQAIDPTLSLNQKTELDAFLKSLHSS